MTNVKKLLEAALYAFNAIPNKKIDCVDFKDTYSLASEISKTINVGIKEFPNGFDSWSETHFEVVEFISRVNNGEDNEVTQVQYLSGTGGLYDLATKWTDEFEALNAGREWDGEYFDEVENFLTEKNKTK